MINPKINEAETLENKQFSLLPSGYHTPNLNLTLRCWLFMSQYERQIIRSLLSSNIQRIPFENNYIYLVNYDSELQLFTIQGDQIIRSNLKNQFASFVKIDSSSKNPKIVSSTMLDRNNILYKFEIDFSRKQIKELRSQLDINKDLNLEDSILLACAVNPAGSQFVAVSNTTIYILNLIEETVKMLKNPLKILYFPSKFNFDQKVFLELSACSKCLMLAHKSFIFIYWNCQLIKKFELEKEQTILNIKLYHEQLIIITNIAIIKIENIFNLDIQLKEEDYYYPLKQFDVKKGLNLIQYGTFEIENQELKSVIIYDSNCKLYLIEMQSIQQGLIKQKEIKAQFQVDDKIEMIEVERKTLQSIVLRILYFKKDHVLGFFEYQGNF